DRSHLHEALAAALAAQNEDASEIARHLEGAGDSEAGARALARAGRVRLDSFAGDEAERLTERGLSLHPGAQTRAELLEIRGEIRARRGNLAAARDDLRAAIALVPSGPRKAHLFTRLATLTS